MQIGVGLVQVGRELAQGLGHQPGLEADVAVAHLALDLGPGRERGHRVDHHDVERTRADEHVGDLEGLLPRVGLGDQQLVDVDADLRRVHRVHGVLGVDVGADAAVALGLGHHVHGQRGLAGGLRAVHLDDPASGQAADAEGEIEGQGPRRDGLHVHGALLAHLHDGTLAVLLLDLAHRHVECLVSLHRELLSCAFDYRRLRCVGAAIPARNLRRGSDNFGSPDPPERRANDRSVVPNECSGKGWCGFARRASGREHHRQRARCRAPAWRAGAPGGPATS